MWRQILKSELASKTDFAQLDFDNIVIEDDDTCEKKIRAIANSLKSLDSYFRPKYKVISDQERYKIYEDSEGRRFGMIYRIEGNIPEKVYCRLLELIKSGSPRAYYEERLDDFNIQFFDKTEGKIKLSAHLESTDTRNARSKAWMHIGYFSRSKKEYVSKLEEAFNVV